jgi:hypothetical protein
MLCANKRIKLERGKAACHDNRSGCEMQSTSAKDKRSDGRRECRTDLTLEEALTGSRLHATAFNYSKGGICIHLDQPLWPDTEFQVRTGRQSSAANVGVGPATVRWCKVVRTTGRSLTYLAGLQFCTPMRSFRPGCRLRIISGGADR